MSRPAFVKLGGSVITDKSKEGNFRRAVTRRLLTEVARSGVPAVIFHGAGSFGHPPAKRAGLGTKHITNGAIDGLCETMGAVARLHGEVVSLAAAAGLKPMPIPLHLEVEQAAGGFDGMPIRRIQALMDEGFTPILYGTTIRHDELGWTAVSADAWMAELAPEIQPRLAVFATDIDGVMDGDELVKHITDADDVPDRAGNGDDVTGSMAGKVEAGLFVARYAPTLIVNGTVRGRLLDALKGKDVPSTRLGTR